MTEKSPSPHITPQTICTPNGTELEISPLLSEDIKEIDDWIRDMYMEQAAKYAGEHLPPERQNGFLSERLDAAIKLTSRFGDGRQILFANVYGLARFTYQAIRAPKMTFTEYHTLLFPDDFLTDTGLDFVVNLYKKIEGDTTPSPSFLINNFIHELTAILKAEADDPATRSKVADATLEFYQTYTTTFPSLVHA